MSAPPHPRGTQDATTGATGGLGSEMGLLDAHDLIVLWRLTGGDVQKCVEVASNLCRVPPKAVLHALQRAFDEEGNTTPQPPARIQSSPDPWLAIRPQGSWLPPALQNPGASMASAPSAINRVREPLQPAGRWSQPHKLQRLVIGEDEALARFMAEQPVSVPSPQRT